VSVLLATCNTKEIFSKQRRFFLEFRGLRAVRNMCSKLTSSIHCSPHDFYSYLFYEQINDDDDDDDDDDADD